MIQQVHMHMTSSIVMLAVVLLLIVVGMLVVIRVAGQRIYDQAARDGARAPDRRGDAS